MKGVRGKCLVAIVLVILLLLQSITPLAYTASAATNSSISIQLNSNLYNAIKNSLRAQSISATYSDSTCTITITETNLERVTYLDLSNSSIDDLTGLSSFKYVTNINLTANELTVDSNLSELDSLPLEKLNLSSNKLESVSTITTFDSIDETDITNQEVTKTEIITVDVSEETNYSTTYIVSLPDILLKDTGILEADWLDEETDGNCSVDWTTVSGSTVRINVATGSGDSYQALTDLVKILVNVKDSTSKLANTKMTLNYVIIDSNQTGIIFEDSNLYQAVKSQLTAGQTDNSELDSYGSSGETLYSKAYDDLLILVIENNTLINKIPSLILNDKKVTNLTGLQEFIGLENELNLSYNYIETIERIIELDENKDGKETELQEKYSSYLSTLSSYRSSLMSALDAEEPDEDTVSTYRNLVKETLEELYNTYERGYLLTTLLTANTYALTFSDIYSSDKDTAQSYAEEIMDKISNLEQEGSLSEWETDLIIEAFDIPTTTSESSEGDEGDAEPIEIENPITAYFDTIKNASDTNTVSIYRTFIEDIKVIDAIVVAGNYCLNERLYGEENSCVLSDGFSKLISDLETLGYNTYYAQLAQVTYTSDCMCSIIDLSDEIADIVSGKYANAEDMVSLLVKIPRLKNLNLEDNSIESIDGIEALEELETLNLYKNLLDDITTVDWSVFTKLTILNLGYNQLSDVNCLDVLSSLEILDVTRNLISGSFSFYLVGMTNLVCADFSYNQISDIAYYTNQYKFYAKAAGMDVKDYVMSSYCPTVKFQYQTLTLKTTVVLSGDFITVDLPSIFEQAESIDYSRTSFGINSLLGTVSADGTTVKLYTPSTGSRTAVVTIEGESGNGDSTDGLAYGTTCTITYDIIQGSIDDSSTDVTDSDDTDTTDPDDSDTDVTDPDDTDTTDPDDSDTDITDPDDTDTTDPDDSDDDATTSDDLEYGYTVVDGYMYVNTPEISLTEFAENVLTSGDYKITVKNGDAAISDNIATGAVVSIDTADGEEVVVLEVVILGDINGDGEVNALDSGMIRNAIKGNTSLIGVFELAADVDMDGDIDSSDALTILRYRADKILSF